MVILRQIRTSNKTVGSGIIIMMTIVTMATAIRTSLYRCMKLPDERGFTLPVCGAAMLLLTPLVPVSLTWIYDPPYNIISNIEISSNDKCVLRAPIVQVYQSLSD